MIIQGKYLLGTAEEISAYLLEDVLYNRTISNESDFRNCDFAIAEEHAKETDLEEIKANSSGWYGIKSLDTGFDSCDLDLFADYYGGGCGVYNSLHEYMSDEECIKVVEEMILATVNYSEVCGSQDMLIAEIAEE